MTSHTALHERDFQTPGSGRGVLDVFKYRYLLRLLLKKGVATRYHGSVLGWVWSYVRPGAQFAMFYMVFGVFLSLNKDLEAFPVYLFSGIVVINLFSEAIQNATSSIIDNQELVRKIYLPRELFPIAATGVALVHFLPQVAILLAACLIMGWTITWVQIAAFLLAVVITLFLALGLGLFFGAINVLYRDAKNVVDLIVMFATWLSPVLYAWTMVRDKVSPWMLELFMLNPLTSAVELFHEAFWLPLSGGSAERPPMLWENAGWSLLIALAFFALGQYVFRKLEGSFAQNI